MMSGGVDGAKATLAVAVWHAGHALRLGTVAQTANGWVDWRNALRGLQMSAPDGHPDERRSGRAEASGERMAIVREPTGGYELAVALWARQQPGGQAHRPHPARVRARSRARRGAQPRRTCEDRPTGRATAGPLWSQPPLPLWQPLASETSELEQVVRRRDEVQEGVDRERRRHEQLGGRPDASTTVRASVERLLQTLEEELDHLERAIAEQVQRQATLRASRHRVLRVPGVGPRVVLPWLVACQRSQAMAGEQGTAKGGIADVGLDPPPQESGARISQRARISRLGDRRWRARLDRGA
jgi:hypothetical protein